MHHAYLPDVPTCSICHRHLLDVTEAVAIKKVANDVDNATYTFWM